MTQSTNPRDAWKQMAADAAAQQVEPNMRVGLGTGSTANFFIQALARRHQSGLPIATTVSSSQASQDLAANFGLPISDLNTTPELDLYIDGADEIDPQLNLIKGGGGALLREKIVASSARRFIVIADSSKLVPKLGQHMPLPIEVVPFALTPIRQHLERLSAVPQLRLTASNQPFVTENHNLILDCSFPNGIAFPQDLDALLHRIPGCHPRWSSRPSNSSIKQPCGFPLTL
jgi:ribose 5-phosphate isomerase A